MRAKPTPKEGDDELLDRYHAGETLNPKEYRRVGNLLRPQSDANRFQAMFIGETRYSGNPCQHGHGTERYVNSKVCTTCAKVYCRKFVGENQDYVKQRARNYNQTEHRKEYMRNYMRNYYRNLRNSD